MEIKKKKQRIISYTMTLDVDEMNKLRWMLFDIKTKNFENIDLEEMDKYKPFVENMYSKVDKAIYAQN